MNKVLMIEEAGYQAALEAVEDHLLRYRRG